jgi:predicted CxxxxCH...CXXCH cytochrome family protein
VGGIANVKISSSFNAAGSNPITIPNATTSGCSNVSCHGNADLPTPVWGASNTFDIYAPGAVNCTKCHLLIGATVAENAAQSSYLEVYNGDNLSGADGSFYGYGSSFNLHWAHRTEAAALTLNGEILCTNCHSGTRMQQQNFHFAQLVNGGKSLTKLAKGAAAATVGDAVDATDTLITSYSYGASAPRGTCTPKSGYGCHSFSSSLTRNWFK